MNNNHLTVSGTFGGMLLSILPHVSTADIYRTVSLAVIGALVSFFVSFILKKLIEDRQKKK